MKNLRDQTDPIFNTGKISLDELRHELLHEKLPLFVIDEFFKMTKNQDDPQDNLVDLLLYFFQSMVAHQTLKAPESIPIHNFKHLLDFVHSTLCHPMSLADRDIVRTSEETGTELEFINYATELLEAGIKFKKSIMGSNLFDIKFRSSGVLEIPPLKVANTTLLLLQSLIDYEKELPDSKPRYVTDYVKFIECLINSPKDVELLRRSGILENWLGNHENIFVKLMGLRREAVISRSFTYADVLKRVNEHCRSRRNLWMANLWRNYFNSPWACVSFLAAVVLILLTVTQTVFAILSYH